jgi:hypothetical protein
MPVSPLRILNFRVITHRQPFKLDSFTIKLRIQALYLTLCDRAALSTKSDVHLYTLEYISIMEIPNLLGLDSNCRQRAARFNQICYGQTLLLPNFSQGLLFRPNFTLVFEFAFVH